MIETNFPDGALSIRDEIKGFVKHAIADNDSSFDTGGGMGQADLWFKVDGVEYLLTIKPTRKTS